MTEQHHPEVAESAEVFGTVSADDRAVAPPRSHFYESQRLRLHYLEWGSKSSPPLLLVHGGKDNAHSWDWTARLLSRYYRVIVPDLRGHGDSDWVRGGDYQLDDFVLDLSTLIDSLELAPLTIVAHSFGGVVSLRYATAYPRNIRQLVVIEGIGKPYQQRDPLAELREWVERTRHASDRIARRYPSVEDAAKRLQESNAAISMDQARHMAAYAVRSNGDSSFSFKFDPYLQILAFPHRYAVEEREAHWANIDKPVLLIHGTDSWLSCDTSWPKHFPKARMTVVPKAGHWVQHDNFQGFMQALDGFLECPR
ncbi:alpha/beta hydrolase [Parahaliea maris]|uniref:Alpha/beta hydrolase n=1 Tax=Parahaliea maris TaxID=2716870 RepID=A0A5C9A739_9GAMM|nr:alpha/beta hydrolase [Parahaliea maris]TXS95834.1 alpha/beta hydrolase [Parahaliea maris]